MQFFSCMLTAAIVSVAGPANAQNIPQRAEPR